MRRQRSKTHGPSTVVVCLVITPRAVGLLLHCAANGDLKLFCFSTEKPHKVEIGEEETAITTLRVFFFNFWLQVFFHVCLTQIRCLNVSDGHPGRSTIATRSAATHLKSSCLVCFCFFSGRVKPKPQKHECYTTTTTSVGDP